MIRLHERADWSWSAPVAKEESIAFTGQGFTIYQSIPYFENYHLKHNEWSITKDRWWLRKIGGDYERPVVTSIFQTSHFTEDKPKSEVWSLKFEVRSVRFEVWMWSLKCELWSRKCEVWSVKCEVWSVKYEVWTLKSEAWTVKFEIEVWLV